MLLLNPLDNHTSTSAILQQNLARTDDESWKEREAVVLSIGAIAKGCITGLYPHLPQVAEINSKSELPLPSCNLLLAILYYSSLISTIRSLYVLDFLVMIGSFLSVYHLIVRLCLFCFSVDRKICQSVVTSYFKF